MVAPVTTQQQPSADGKSTDTATLCDCYSKGVLLYDTTKSGSYTKCRYGTTGNFTTIQNQVTKQSTVKNPAEWYNLKTLNYKTGFEKLKCWK